jgi:hypothetical protein
MTAASLLAECCRPVRPSLKPVILLGALYRCKVAARVGPAGDDHDGAGTAGLETGMFARVVEEPAWTGLKVRSTASL